MTVLFSRDLFTHWHKGLTSTGWRNIEHVSTVDEIEEVLLSCVSFTLIFWIRPGCVWSPEDVFTRSSREGNCRENVTTLCVDSGSHDLWTVLLKSCVFWLPLKKYCGVTTTTLTWLFFMKFVKKIFHNLSNRFFDLVCTQRLGEVQVQDSTDALCFCIVTQILVWNNLTGHATVN